jgi:Zn-dependent protease
MNPLKYTHPLMSIGFPLLFLLMGGIGLPGGAVYIERHRLRNRWWHSAVSAAGPFATFLCLVAYAAPFWTGYVTPEVFWKNEPFWAAIAFLIWLEAFSLIINLLPIPPLDGYGIIEPFLPDEVALQIRTTLGGMSFFLILILMLVTPFGDLLRDQANDLTDVIMTNQQGMDHRYSGNGYHNFRFWDEE